MNKKFTDLAILAIIGDVENKHNIHCIMNTVYYNFKNSNNKYKKNGIIIVAYLMAKRIKEANIQCVRKVRNKFDKTVSMY
jgi:hypothetical protein